MPASAHIREGAGVLAQRSGPLLDLRDFLAKRAERTAQSPGEGVGSEEGMGKAPGNGHAETHESRHGSRKPPRPAAVTIDEPAAGRAHAETDAPARGRAHSNMTVDLDGAMKKY